MLLKSKEGELLKNILQNLRNKLPPQTVCFGMISNLLKYLDGARNLVGRPGHLGEGQDELFIGADGDVVAILVDPAQDKVGPPEGAGEEGNQLLLERKCHMLKI